MVGYMNFNDKHMACNGIGYMDRNDKYMDCNSKLYGL